MSLVYVFGSGECEQLGLGDDQPLEIKKPRRVPLFDTGLVGRRILKIVCGGMHTVALSTQGKVYTWGCNDEGALGREGPENQPLEVASTLNVPITDITAGDCHTIAYNTDLNQIFCWGLYRNAMTGRTYDPVRVPTRIGMELFKSNKKVQIQKVASGAHHTLVLTTDGKIYGWGDAESGKIGRMLNTRNKNQQALRIERVNARNAVDVFCGKQHSFYINKKGQVFAWGLNNQGQLGVGHRKNTAMPTRIKGLDDLNVVQISGGEHHSIAATKDGKVYCWGRNDEGQAGVGDLYGEYRKKKAQEQYEQLMKKMEEEEQQQEQKRLQEQQQVLSQAEEQKQAQGQQTQEQTGQVEAKESQEHESKEEEKKEEPKKPKRGGKRKKKAAEGAEQAKEEDLVNIYYFNEPQLVQSLWPEDDPEKRKKISSVYAAGSQCYALEVKQESKTNQLYSWGFGASYVLGNREEDNEFKPYAVHPKMFEEMPVMMLAAGTQHVAVLTTDSQDKQELPTFEEGVLQFKLAQEEQIGSQMIQESKKRKRNEFEENKTEDEKEKDTEEEDKQAAKLPEELEVDNVTAVSKGKGQSRSKSQSRGKSPSNPRADNTKNKEALKQSNVKRFKQNEDMKVQSPKAAETAQKPQHNGKF